MYHLIAVSRTKNYGAITETNTTSNSPRRIYCVHGKPSSGCCKVLEGEIIDMEDKDVDIASHTKENFDTTNLGKFFRPNRLNTNAAPLFIRLVNKHCHKSRSEAVDKRARRKLIIASILCVVFMIAEVIGNFATRNRMSSCE